MPALFYLAEDTSYSNLLVMLLIVQRGQYDIFHLGACCVTGQGRGN